MAADGSVIIEILGDDSKLEGTLGKLNKTATTALKGIGTAVSAATAATTAAAVDVGKQAIEAYADYEQLVGGVETLFRDSADVVQEYAANAYKTAGMSANAYMETVTSFSASLLQSLGGNTVEAVKVADMAITDMADNANKMGSSIDSIQNAYQGFAKQNYTMLDNLKLGYGGTKEEMERLLADAEKLSGIRYDISNLNDVYNAIHVIQTEMGITGTTAKEAGETISGSMASAKAAFTNLLAGMADDKQDVTALMEDLVESIGTALENLAPRVDIVVDNIMTLITESVPKIAEEFGPKLGEAINSIVDGLPELIDTGVSVVESVLDGIRENADAVSAGAIEVVGTFAAGVVELIPLLADTAWALVQGIAQYIVENGPELVTAAAGTVASWIQGLHDHLPEIVLAAVAMIGSLALGLVKSIPTVIEAVDTVFSTIADAFWSVDWLAFGKYIIEGIADGIASAVGALVDAAKNAAQSALNAAKDFLGIHSPSTVFRDEVGKQIPSGIGEGVEDQMPVLSQQVQDELDALMQEAHNTALSENGDIGASMGARTQPKPDSATSVPSGGFGGAQNAPQQITIKFGGDMAQLIRVLRPYIDEEDARRGPDPARGG